MLLPDFIEIFAATFGFVSGIFFCIGVLRLKDSTLEEIATSFYDSGEALAHELVLQKSDFIFGAILFACAFLMQLVSKFTPAWEMSCKHLVIASVTLLTLLLLTYPASRWLSRNAIKKFRNKIKSGI